MNTIFTSIQTFIRARRIPSLMVAAITLSMIGCEPSAPKPSKAPEGDAHSHDHDAHGPNGGHMIHLEPSDAHAEWTHDDDSGKLTIHLEEVAKSGKKIDSVKVELEVKGEPKKDYEFTSFNEGVYELISPELMTAIDIGSADKEKVTAKLVVSIDGKSETTMLEHHEHHH